jgi:hypothetical protein
VEYLPSKASSDQAVFEEAADLSLQGSTKKF